MADLYIRWSETSPKDVGVRPLNPCWPPNAFWTNVSMWLTYPPNHPDPAKQNQTAPFATLGEEVWINVAVYSKGNDFAYPQIDGGPPIRCQVWVCTGANGVGPVSALASSGGQAGLTSLVLGLASPPDFAAMAWVPWTPAAGDSLAFDGSGNAHVCLAANLVYPAPAGSTPPAQGQSLPQFVTGGPPLTTIFPCGDGPVDPRSNVPIGHFQGQKNIQVHAVTSMSVSRSEIRVWGRGGKRGLHSLELVERGGRTLAPVIREQLLAHPAVAIVGGRPRRHRLVRLDPRLRVRLEAELGAALDGVEGLPAEPFERAQLARGGRLVLTDDPGVALEPARRPLAGLSLDGVRRSGDRLVVTAGARKPSVVGLDLEPVLDDAPGTVRVFDLVERDDGGRLVGGTTFVTVRAVG